MTTLQDYITTTRRLLHDSTAVFWTDAELTDYINQGRNRLIRDTGVKRVVQNSIVIYNQEQYTFADSTGTVAGILVTNPGSGYTTTPTVTISSPPSGNTATANATLGGIGQYGTADTGQVASVNLLTGGDGYVSNPTVTISGGGGTGAAAQAFLDGLPEGIRTMDILNINLYWGNTRIPLRYLPWTQFNAELRFWQNYVGRPIAFSMYGPNSFYVSPIPDQNYAIELDTICRPTDLVTLDQIETDIPHPWQNPVPFYAAYQAKYKEQSYGEAELFKQQYVANTQNVLSNTFTRRMPDPYSRPY